MKIVVLDGGTLPVSIPKPKWCKEWVFRNHTSFQELVPVLKNADVAITNKVGLCKEVLENLPKLRHVCVAATGYDCIDIDFCSQNVLLLVMYLITLIIVFQKLLSAIFSHYAAA